MNSPVRLSRFTRGDKRRIGVSFELPNQAALSDSF